MFLDVIIHIGMLCCTIAINYNKYYTINVKHCKVLTHKSYLGINWHYNTVSYIVFLTIFSYQVIPAVTIVGR